MSDAANKPSENFDNTSLTKYLALFFIEPDGKPLANLKVKLVAGTVDHLFRTDSKGTFSDSEGGLRLIPFGADTTECTVSAILPTGVEEIVFTAKLDNRVQGYTCRSPYTLAKAETIAHDPAAKPTPKAEPKPIPAGTQIATVSDGGHPVMQIAVPPIDKVHNLRLDSNEQYRDLILAAAERSKIIPQSVAALINTESGKAYKTITIREAVPAHQVPGKVAVLRNKVVNGVVQRYAKSGKKHKAGDPIQEKVMEDGMITIPATKAITKTIGIWDPGSKNGKSSATGLSQFLDGSWCDMAVTQGTYLFKAALDPKRGYIENHPKKNGIKTAAVKEVKGHPEIPEVKEVRDKHGKVLVKGHKYVPAQAHVDARKAEYYYKDCYVVVKEKKADLLHMRNEPEFAIHTAVDSAVLNMDKLKEDKRYKEKVSKITNDSDKAKLYYMMHQLGIGDAKKFIDNTITEKHAKYLLEKQVNYTDKKTGNEIDVAAIKAKAEEDDGVPKDSCYIFAHRRWLIEFIDDNIYPPSFAVDYEKIAAPQDLYELIKNVGGKHPDKFIVPPSKKR